jgi:uncharacterized surface protein with fasciclin (FAS1) repeats
VNDLDTDVWTVFAPLDEAFRQLPSGIVSGLTNDVGALTDLMLFHIVPGVSYNQTQLICDNQLVMANNEVSTTMCYEEIIDSDGDAGTFSQQVKGQVGDGNFEMISDEDEEEGENDPRIPRIVSSVEACNGQIHVIDSLML